MAKRGPPEFPWFRVYVDITRDLKIRREPFCHRWVWVAVMALARRSPQPGRLLLSEGLPVTVADIADEANATPAQVRSALAVFADRKMMTEEAGVLVVTNWRKRQPESDRKYAGNSPEITDELPGNSRRDTGLDTDTEVPSEPSETEPEGETDTQHPAPQAAEEPDGSPRSRALALSDRSLDAEFTAWWRVWPKRDGKHLACEAYKKRRRAGRSAESLLSAAEHVAESVESGASELRYTPLPATFLNQRRDEDWEHGPPVPPSPPNGRNGGGSTLSRNLANLAAITPGVGR